MNCDNFVYYILSRPGDDWKKTLKLPPKDLRIKTSVSWVVEFKNGRMGQFQVKWLREMTPCV